jgi:hypothetical protein
MNSPDSPPTIIQTLFNTNGDTPHFIWLAVGLEIAFALFLIVSGFRIWRKRQRAREFGEQPAGVGNRHKP